MKGISYRTLLSPFISQRTRAVVQQYNPTKPNDRPDPESISIFVYDYNSEQIKQEKLYTIQSCFPYVDSPHVTWINVDGLRKADVESLCSRYHIHYLIQEDILSIGQRPKMDEIDGIMFCLLNMLYFNEITGGVEQEQISIVMGQHFVISFQEDAKRDVFNPLREKLQFPNSRIRLSRADYLFYTMIDLIVDNFFVVMEKLGERIEEIEEEIIRKASRQTLNKVNQMRKEMIVLKRNLNPVRDLISGILRSDSELLDAKTEKFFKDIYDHIVQASDLAENYRDMVMSLQDLYLNNVNLKMNEIMKFLAIVTTLMAPATVIGGIFGMNFETIPYLHNHFGFWFAVAIMILAPLLMIYFFWKRGWFAKDIPTDGEE
ncbi:MAG: magnesium/cobalt transporter CorA [Chitinophagaceae bacterium]